VPEVPRDAHEQDLQDRATHGGHRGCPAGDPTEGFSAFADLPLHMQFLHLAGGYRDERVPDATEEEKDAAQEHLRCGCGRWRDARHGMARHCARSREALHDVPDQPKSEPRGSKAISSTPQLI